MRYLLITYLRKADGRIDEQVAVANTVKPRDIQTCNVILDFKNKTIDKSVIDGKPMDLNWENVHTYYSNLYPSVVERLEQEANEE
jgi:hypothetical protein